MSSAYEEFQKHLSNRSARQEAQRRDAEESTAVLRSYWQEWERRIVPDLESVVQQFNCALRDKKMTERLEVTHYRFADNFDPRMPKSDIVLRFPRSFDRQFSLALIPGPRVEFAILGVGPRASESVEMGEFRQAWLYELLSAVLKKILQ